MNQLTESENLAERLETLSPPVSDDSSEEKVMTVVEHLDELRTRIIRCILAVAACCGGMLFVAKDIVRFLEAPAGGISFQALSLEEPLLVYLKVTFYAGIILSLPYILWEASQFVAPGLRPNERKILSPIVFGGPLLFVSGAAFAYYCVLPPMLHFFSSFGQGITPVHQRLDFYISLVSSLLLYMGLCFQLPVIIFALSFTGLVNSRQLLSVWKYAVFGASVAAAIITPDPTAFSMLIVMGALVGLYFLSIALLKVFGR
jgi:sec-independent protein translocase protein TatC